MFKLNNNTEKGAPTTGWHLPCQASALSCNVPPFCKATLSIYLNKC